MGDDNMHRLESILNEPRWLDVHDMRYEVFCGVFVNWAGVNAMGVAQLGSVNIYR